MGYRVTVRFDGAPPQFAEVRFCVFGCTLDEILASIDGGAFDWHPMFPCLDRTGYSVEMVANFLTC